MSVGGFGRKKKPFSSGYNSPSSALRDDLTAYPSWQLLKEPGLVTLAPDRPRRTLVNTSCIRPYGFIENSVRKRNTLAKCSYSYSPINRRLAKWKIQGFLKLEI